MTLNEPLAIAEKAHAGLKDKAGGSYIDFLKSVAEHLKNKGESEEVQALAVLQDILTPATKLSEEDVLKMGVPAEMIARIKKMTYHKNQGWIDEYSCKSMAQGVPVSSVRQENKYIHRQERRERKTQFRLKKYKAAIAALEE